MTMNSRACVLNQYECVNEARLYAIIERLTRLENRYPGILEPELFDFLDVIENGAKKYAPGNWLKVDGKTASHKDMHNSIFHHVAESYAGLEKDRDSGLNPKLHGACRLLMSYTRQKRGIKHVND